MTKKTKIPQNHLSKEGANPELASISIEEEEEVAGLKVKLSKIFKKQTAMTTRTKINIAIGVSESACLLSWILALMALFFIPFFDIAPEIKLITWYQIYFAGLFVFMRFVIKPLFYMLGWGEEKERNLLRLIFATLLFFLGREHSVEVIPIQSYAALTLSIIINSLIVFFLILYYIGLEKRNRLDCSVKKRQRIKMFCQHCQKEISEGKVFILENKLYHTSCREEFPPEKTIRIGREVSFEVAKKLVKKNQNKYFFRNEDLS